jgi:hypothetical protein
MVNFVMPVAGPVHIRGAIQAVRVMQRHRKRTAFFVELVKREIKLHRQRQALRAATGVWKAEDHPELAEGAARWVHEIRQESVKRFEKIQRHRKAK